MDTEKHFDKPNAGDRELWYIAKKRVSFKRQLGAYVIINTMLWLLWYFTRKDANNNDDSFPWPVWPMFGWGIGLAFAYMKAYVYPKSNAVDREHEKLKNN